MLNDFPDTHILSIIFIDKLWNLMVPIQRYTVFLLFLISYIWNHGETKAMVLTKQR